MKKLMALLVTAAILTSAVGCGSGVAQSDYDSVVAEKESLSLEVDLLKKEVEEDLIAEVQRLRAENAYLKKLNALVSERVRQEKKHK